MDCPSHIVMKKERYGYSMNIAVIFAGGTGQRMNTKTKPKQFLELHGKPILVYTLEHFQCHKEIDAIVLVILESWMEHCSRLIERYQLTKVKGIVSGGASGQESIYRGLTKVQELFPDDSIVLIHDGVRPLIDEETISKNIECVKKYGSAITVTPAIETIAIMEENDKVGQIVDRKKCQMAKAPQSFYLKDILAANHKAQQEGHKEFIDCASIMQYYGYPLYTVEGKPENIKITTPEDFYIFRAFVDVRENTQIFGF